MKSSRYPRFFFFFVCSIFLKSSSLDSLIASSTLLACFTCFLAYIATCDLRDVMGLAF